ncbi:unnamed protein product, partial [Didymodactylos carnosus]
IYVTQETQAQEKKGDEVAFQLACQFGKLVSSFTVESLVPLKHVCPSELKAVDIAELENITLIEACKLFVRGSILSLGGEKQNSSFGRPDSEFGQPELEFQFWPAKFGIFHV